jgi:hypothetical protein
VYKCLAKSRNLRDKEQVKEKLKVLIRRCYMNGTLDRKDWRNEPLVR